MTCRKMAEIKKLFFLISKNKIHFFSPKTIVAGIIWTVCKKKFQQIWSNKKRSFKRGEISLLVTTDFRMKCQRNFYYLSNFLIFFCTRYKRFCKEKHCGKKIEKKNPEIILRFFLGKFFRMIWNVCKENSRNLKDNKNSVDILFENLLWPKS